MNIVIHRSDDAQGALRIAQMLPEYFDKGGLDSIEHDSKDNVLYGAYDGESILLTHLRTQILTF